MATAIPLPKYAALPNLVIFHREHPGEPILLMQVPTNEARSEFETYYVKLEVAEHKGWFDRLPNAKGLLDKLGYVMHVAFCPQTGYMQEMPDLDAPNDMAMAVGFARQMAGADPQQGAVERRRRIEAVAPMPISSLRQRLGGPEQRLYRNRGGRHR